MREADGNLMEAAIRVIELRLQSLIVVEQEKSVGVIRGENLFFELGAIVKS